MSEVFTTATEFQGTFTYYFQLMSGGHTDIKSATSANPQGRFRGPRTNPPKPGDIFGSDTEMFLKHGPRFRRLLDHEVQAYLASQAQPEAPVETVDLPSLTIPQLKDYAGELGIEVDDTMKKAELISWIEQNLAAE